jgi:alpha-amylase
MFTVGGAPGDVHSYFSHFEKPYDAFATFFSVIHDFDARLRAMIKRADYPFVLPDGKEFWSLKGLCDHIERARLEEADESIKEYLKRDDFERWVRESVGEEEIADKLRELSLSMEREDYNAQELREALVKLVCKE